MHCQPTQSTTFEFVVAMNLKPSKTPSSLVNSIRTLATALFTHSTKKLQTSTLNYETLIEQCIQSKSLVKGKLIHQHIIKIGNNRVILEKLTHLYATCNAIEYARKVFDTIPKPRVLLWNLLIRGYAWNGPFEEGVNLYYRMTEMGLEPTKYTYSFVIKACSGLHELEVGREVHCRVKRVELDDDVYICTALVDLYAKCGDLDEAKRVFWRMTKRDVVAWNAMIAGVSLHGLFEDVMGLVVGMQLGGVSPNSSTIVGALPAVAEAGALREGKVMHGYCVRRGFNDDLVAATGLLDMYAKCRCISYSKRIFYFLGVRNEITWSAMIGACVTCDLMREAIELFDEMMVNDLMNPTPVALASVLRACAKLTDLRRGRGLHCFAIKSGLISDVMLGNTLLSLYAKCGIIGDASSFFDEMRVKDTVSYSAIISGCVQNGMADEALHIFHEMNTSRVHPDLATMVGILPACAHLAALQHGACCHSYAILHGFGTDTSVCNALIDMYSKCGQIKIARQVFDTMHHHRRDIVSWNTMILGYGIHGLGKEALYLFDTMQAGGLNPDDVTFICLLSACSHSGLVAEGKHWFDAMSQDLNIIPRMEHYICMTDLLGRAGLLAEAHDFIQRMPLEPDVRIWATLLAACRIHRNIKLGEQVSEKIQILGPESPGNFVLLSNMYSTFGRWNDAAQIRIMQRDQGHRKSPGCSWVEINGVVHAFIGGDRSHPETVHIERKLDELLVLMKQLGYSAENISVYQDVEEEEKERILLYHSEKLAIAYAILDQNPDKPILVTKNLRVCGDCHAAIKLITLITKREITIRDASRFHHFKDGICNCGDFW